MGTSSLNVQVDNYILSNIIQNMNENKTPSTKLSENDIEKKKELYIKRARAIYKIQRIYLIITSIFVSTIIIFGVIVFYNTKSTYSIALTVIGIIYVVRNIVNFRKLKEPDISKIEETINQEINNSNLDKKSDNK